MQIKSINFHLSLFETENIFINSEVSILFALLSLLTTTNGFRVSLKPFSITAHHPFFCSSTGTLPG